MKSPQIRQKFLDYFEKNGHTVVPSSSLIPAEDPTLLFANAGMNQFKDAFLGIEKRAYTRATSIQKCVRAGGKHNDLEQVGFTARHLTFFEMMGNFSFGDYFKKEAIAYAWEFLTKDMGLDGKKLYPTVFTEDDDSYDLWAKIVPQERITRLGADDNFWSMGDTGPCGPCTEIYFDRGSEIGCKQKTCAPGCECDRFTEIWNLVFMQYNRDEYSNLNPLTQTGVDTGMGFERLVMVMQDKESVYDTDVFAPLITKIEALSGKDYDASDHEAKAAFRVLCDHVRSTSLLIADGCTPSNEGRGYVLRKIIRRAALFAQKLTDRQDLFPALAGELVAIMAPVYPELQESATLIDKLLTAEIERFAANLPQGQAILQTYLEDNLKNKVVSGEHIFKLYDTYGFPPELTKVIAEESSFTLDMDGFDVEMAKQKGQSGKKAADKKAVTVAVPEDIATTFTGYESLESTSKVLFVEPGDAGRSGSASFVWIVAEQSPFYVESGGQVNDEGIVSINDKAYPVLDLKKVGKAIAVKIKTSDTINVGDTAHCVVNNQARTDTVRNHTATHMLQAALTQVLGAGVKQAGSVVEPDYLRFDFNHHAAMTKEEIVAVEDLINAKIQQNIQMNAYETTLAKAKEAGVISFFGEKYNPECVRVVEIPGFSAELCGGTHAPATGIIGAFKITSEAALSAGVRRIVAVTGPKAVELFRQSFDTVKKLGEQFKVKPHEVLGAVERVQAQLRDVQGELKGLKKQLWKSSIPKWASEVAKVGSVPLLYLELDGVGNDELRSIAGEIEKSTPGLYVLVSKTGDRVSFVAHLSKGVEVDMKAFGTFLKDECGLRGGGSKTLIQGGGSYAKGLGEKIKGWVAAH